MSANFAGVSSLFGRNGLPTVVSDCEYVLEKFRQSGFRTVCTNMVRNREVAAPDGVLLIPAVPSQHPDNELSAALDSSAVLVVPLLAFAPGVREVNYLLDRLSSLSFAETCDKNRQLVEFVQHMEHAIQVESAGCELEVRLGDNVDVMVPKLLPEIALGQWISIIQYLEVGLVPNAENSSFLVNGTLLCEGVTVAHHLHSHFESGPPADQAWKLFSEIRRDARFPIVLTIQDSVLRSVRTVDGEELIERILPLTDEIMRGSLTEVAFGALPASAATDWTINSQLNEPAGGFHIGIGAGETAAHIDFVSPNAKYH